MKITGEATLFTPFSNHRPRFESAAQAVADFRRGGLWCVESAAEGAPVRATDIAPGSRVWLIWRDPAGAWAGVVEVV